MVQEINKFIIKIYFQLKQSLSSKNLHEQSFIKINKFNFMFNLCQKVNIYNIENHFHFQPEKEASTKKLLNIDFNKLKTGSISMTNCTSSKRGSKSCSKKWLNLSKNLNLVSNVQQQQSRETGPKLFLKDQPCFSVTDKSQLNLGSQTIKNRLQNEKISDKVFKTNNNMAKIFLQQESVKRKLQIRKQFPMTESYKIQNEMSTQKMYSTQHLSTLKSKKSGKQINTSPYLSMQESDRKKLERFSLLKNKKQSCQQIKLQSQHNRLVIKNSYTKQSNFDLLQSSNKQPSELINKFQANRKQIEHNSKYNISHLGAFASSIVTRNSFIHSNEYLSPQTFNIEIRKASTILSDILSRNTSKQIDYQSYHGQIRSSLIFHKKRLNLYDKKTILSQENQGLSQFSAKIQQSQILDLDPKENFILIKNNCIKSSIYEINLAIQRHINFIVSLKEIGFMQMSSISQQLQIYEFVQQILRKRDIYRNILELFQVQTTNGSYIFIKQAYTCNFQQFVKKLKPGKIDCLIQQLSVIVKLLLSQFAYHKIYPTRLLKRSDFVICESVIKIHDLSLFRQSKHPIFSHQQIIECLVPTNHQQSQILRK